MTNKQQDMINLLDEMYWNANYSSSIDYFSQFINELKKYELAEILAYQAKFPFLYVISFLLSTPLLWMNKSVMDWVVIMSALNPRPKPFKIDIEDAGYIDIPFLCKYMRVNAIELFLQQEIFSNQDKEKILLYSNKVAIFLFMDELDIEFLDGEDWVHLDLIEVAKLNLVSSGRINQFQYTEDELTEYIQKELKAFSILEE
ncbi:MAG: hypothetical protein V7L01_27485 [Nostoc sp.]|uniref:hypothetical protein n=1 Tax=Nostoc sp. TaxID=1180 RepID=UPI002FFAF250